MASRCFNMEGITSVGNNMHCVITSKENFKIPSGIAAEVEIRSDVIIWKFSTKEKAATAAKKFMEAGVEYVQQIDVESRRRL